MQSREEWSLLAARRVGTAAGGVVFAGSKKSRCSHKRSGHCQPGPCLTQYLGWNLVNPTQSRFQCGGSHLDSVGRLALDVS